MNGTNQGVQEVAAEMVARWRCSACSGALPNPRRSCARRRLASVVHGRDDLLRKEANEDITKKRTTTGNRERGEGGTEELGTHRNKQRSAAEMDERRR